MRGTIIGCVVAFLALLPRSDGGGVSLYQRWMDAYEKYLYQQMEDNFRREAEVEQTASEEAAEPDNATTTVAEALSESQTAVIESAPEDIPVPTVETVVESTPTIAQTPLYQVDGYIPDEGLQTYLYQRLCEAGIGYFFPYAVCLIAQESTWNPAAENPNGLDKGLLQYRITYWPTLEWWNPYAEIDVFVQQMANRANIGCTVSDMISRHNQSDWGSYCQSYVDAVMAHANTLVQLR